MWHAIVVLDGPANGSFEGGVYVAGYAFDADANSDGRVNEVGLVVGHAIGGMVVHSKEEAVRVEGVVGGSLEFGISGRIRKENGDERGAFGNDARGASTSGATGIELGSLGPSVAGSLEALPVACRSGLARHSPWQCETCCEGGSKAEWDMNVCE